MGMVCRYGTLAYIKSLSEELCIILFIIVIIIVYV